MSLVGPFNAFIISWSGTEDRARMIAASVVGEVDSLTVIYSNTSDTDLIGPGDWVRVPDEWFYGRKFRACLERHGAGIMLQIQADAECDDWPDLIRKCRVAHASDSTLGIWAPDIRFTPWESALVDIDQAHEDDVVPVAQTDGIVWSIVEPIVSRLRLLDYEQNNLGWGIDWIAGCCARVSNLRVLRDRSILVRHPPGAGYSRDEARQQMDVFLRQMTSQERDQFLLLNSLVELRARQRGEVPLKRVGSPSPSLTVPPEGLVTELRRWPSLRAAGITERLRGLITKPEISYTFESGIPASIFRYFPANLDQELAAWTPGPFRYIPAESATEAPDIVIVTTHGNDLSERLWAIRERCVNDPVVVIWCWDNHTGYLANLVTATAADFVIPCHSNEVSYLFNNSSVVSSHVPLCCAQWSRDEAERFFASHGAMARKHKLLINYVSYPYAVERNEVIARMGTEIPEAEVLLMPAHDRTRYFAGTTEGRFAEWTAYKATIILPVTTDLSTRFFDALLAGLVPIVPRAITDVDRIIPAETLDALGVVRIGSYDIEEIRNAVHEALYRFDVMGHDGVLARHRFVLEHHMLINRVTAILHLMYMHAARELGIEFSDGAFGHALYQVVESHTATGEQG